MCKVDLVVARYLENLFWLKEFHLPHRVIIYNDGLELPDDVLSLDLDLQIRAGDKNPSESGKYLEYILSGYFDSSISDDCRVIFLQGDPIYHSPDLIEILNYVNLFDSRYENLSLWGHPPPWGYSNDILYKKNISGIKYFGSGRVWSDSMDLRYQGSYFYDHWLLGVLENDFNCLSFFRNLGFSISDASLMRKCYSALFSTSWGRIRNFDYEFWFNLRNFLSTGKSKYGSLDYSHLSYKMRSVLFEYMWCPLFELGFV
jgi:hypothetical protein